MKTLKKYHVVAAGSGQSGGHVLLGPRVVTEGAVAASQSLGVSHGAHVAGHICSARVNAATAEKQKLRGTMENCEQLTALHHEIRQLSSSLSQKKAPKMQLLSGQDITATALNVESMVLQKGDVLRLSGTPGQQIVVNVSGYAKIDAGASVQLSGVSSQDVFFNFLPNPQYPNIDIAADTLAGVYVSQGRSFRLSDDAVLVNARFYTTANVQVFDHRDAEHAQLVVQESAPVDVVNVSEPALPFVMVLFLFALRRAQQRLSFHIGV